MRDAQLHMHTTQFSSTLLEKYATLSNLYAFRDVYFFKSDARNHVDNNTFHKLPSASCATFLNRAEYKTSTFDRFLTETGYSLSSALRVSNDASNRCYNATAFNKSCSDKCIICGCGGENVTSYRFGSN